MTGAPLGAAHAPDMPWPVLGWRTWDVERRGDGQALVSVVHRHAWPHGEELTATCARRALWRRRVCDAPRSRCSCGIHAFRALDEALPYLWYFAPGTGVGRVVGRVWMWGTVVECELGWRSQFAYPADLVVPVRRGAAEATAFAVAGGLAGYGVTVRVAAYARPRELAQELADIDAAGIPALGRGT